MGIFTSSKLKIFGLFLLATAPAAVRSHGTEVRYCISPDGENVRAFVEHWHGDLTDPLFAGQMLITDVLNANSPTLYDATGVINNVEQGDLWDGRCLESFTTAVTECVSGPAASGCSSNGGFPACFQQKDWVYYDFPLECNEPVEFRFEQGLTIVLEDGCPTQPGGGAYPATIQGTFNCTASPTPSPTRSPTIAHQNEPSGCGCGCDCTSYEHGDPHFDMWSTEEYDYHGECDMIHVTNKFLDIHIRTVRRGGFSAVERAVLKFTGRDVPNVDKLEVFEDGTVWVNGSPTLTPIDLDGSYTVTTVGQQTTVQLDNGQFIRFTSRGI